MKKILKIILPILLTIAILVSIGWYFFQYDKAFTRDMLLSWARDLDDAGNYTMANWFYKLAYRQAGNDDAIAIEIARQYKEQGNYTQAEATLSDAISEGGSVELYMELCRTYIEQDKLLDAVNMLDTIPDPAIKQSLDAMRPAMPVANIPSDSYEKLEKDFSISFSCPDGKVYANFEGKYPSVKKDFYTTPHTLGVGVTIVRAVSVSPDGLVSPLQTYNYTVTMISQTITLSDHAIDRTVREMLGLDPDYPLTTDDLFGIESLMVPDDCSNLNDLYYMPKMKALVIRNCSIADLSPLGNLKELEDLVIENVTLSVDALETIGKLTSLKYLTASRCSLSTAKPFSSLTNLEYLDLNNNAIGDISFLSGMSGLTYLDMSHNALVSLEGMEELVGLTQLNISYNAVASLQPLSQCTQLRMLEAVSNALTDLNGLENATKLGLLYASSNQLTNISALAQTVSMADLDISRNQIKDLSALSQLPNLYMLNFSYNEVSKLPEFPEGSILTEINGSHNKLKSLDPLAGLCMLTQVKMSHNAGIKSVNALISCESLMQVDVLETAVKDISAFKDTDVIILYNLA